MSLQIMEFSFAAAEDYRAFPKKWSHTGVVGSGDMEVLIRSESLDGKVNFKVVTPVKGFDEIWQKVLLRFVEESKIGDAIFEINDNNSTPFVAAMRLKQSLWEVEGEDTP